MKKKIPTKKEIFLEELALIVKVFFFLQKEYQRDDNRVLDHMELFRSFLEQFSKKYPALDIFLDESDLTLDDLKICLPRIKNMEELENEMRENDAPLMTQYSKRHDCMQVLVNYDRLDDDFNESLQVLCRIAIKDSGDEELQLPGQLKLLLV